VSADY